MRFIYSLLFLIFIGNFSQAQDKTNNTKVVAIQMPIEDILKAPQVNFENLPTLTGFYKVKYARVKIALSFKIKGRKAKLV